MATIARKMGDVGKTPKTPDLDTYSGRLALRIRSLREEKNMSVETIVDRVNRFGYDVATPTFYHWENGNRDVALDALPAIAKALRVKIADLMPST